MSRFRYCADPLCLVACGLYAANRFWWRQAGGAPFFRNHFDDLLLIPCALPGLLWVQRRLGLREHDRFPGTGEIAFHLLVWSVIAEALGPALLPRAVADLRDVLAYAAGALVALGWWRLRGRAEPPAA